MPLSRDDTAVASEPGIPEPLGYRATSAGSGRTVECGATVIDRDEVLHVARLARLALSEEEIEPMARELSAVLDHIAKIAELDLDDVRADVTRGRGHRRAARRMCRARRCRARSRSRRRPAVDGDGFLVPSPQA